MENQINLETLAGGAFAERTRQAIQEVMQNIADPNTDFKFKRKVTLDLTFIASEDREIVMCEAIAKVKNAPKLSVVTKFLLDQDLDGEILAAEYKKQIPGQQAMKIEHVDLDTGEVTVVAEPKENNTDGLKVIK